MGAFGAAGHTVMPERSARKAEEINMRSGKGREIVAPFRPAPADLVRRATIVAILALAASGFASMTHAQDAASYPSRPIRVIVPQAPGAGTDVGGRLVSEAAEKHLGQRIVVENKPGAGGRI